jgi:2'-5' RNA ligase
VEELLRIGERVAQVAQPFHLRLDQAEVWPQGGIAHLAPAHIPCQLLALREALMLAVVQAEINCDQRTFRPHLTLARRARAQDVPPVFTPIDWNVGELSLVRSILGSGHYVVLARWRL